MSDSAVRNSPRSLVASQEVITAAGAAIKVTKLILTPEGKATLQSKSAGITSASDRPSKPAAPHKYPATK
ncbi:hypothetical protein [Variovorax sp. DAIF25]|uniref:hypothetical protein n=1 Tax=Variovorax sp. DAIF25 TaxID=3080983 RepID=UPI003D6A6E46